MVSLSTPKKRLSLASDKEHAEKLWTGAALIYERPEGKGIAGKWTARLTHKEAGQKRKKIGTADDFTTSDNFSIFSYDEAKVIAAEKIKELNREIEAKITGKTAIKDYKVKDAIRDYLHYMVVNDKSSRKTFGYMMNAHVIPKLGEILVIRLTKEKVEKWRHELAEQPRSRTIRRGDGTIEKVMEELPKTDEEKRKRKFASNQALTNLKIALNEAVSSGRVEHPLRGSWKDVKPYKGVKGYVREWLNIEEQKKLIESCENPDFKNLVICALKTGARYQEIAKLVVGDYNKREMTIRFGPFGKVRGLVRFVALDEEDIEFFDKLTEGKSNSDLIFTRKSKRQFKNRNLGNDNIWRNQDQAYYMKLAVEKAGLSPKITFHVLRHSFISLLVMAGVPLSFIANQSGHTTTKQIEIRYGHLCPKGVQDTVRAKKQKLLQKIL